MKLTCAQMDVLLSFYFENELSKTLRNQVEEHLKHCSTCRAKYDIIKSMFSDLKNCVSGEETSISKDKSINQKTTSKSSQYRVFQNNLSAYMDNELSNEESIKIKKFTINNPEARKELEENYSIKKIMNDSFKKCKSEVRQDFSRSVLKQLELEEEAKLGIHPVIKILVSFTMTVLILTSLVLMSLSV